jgi:hypothetical protein
MDEKRCHGLAIVKDNSGKGKNGCRSKEGPTTHTQCCHVPVNDDDEWSEDVFTLGSSCTHTLVSSSAAPAFLLLTVVCEPRGGCFLRAKGACRELQ